MSGLQSMSLEVSPYLIQALLKFLLVSLLSMKHILVPSNVFVLQDRSCDGGMGRT